MGINLEKAMSKRKYKFDKELWSKMEYNDILYIIAKTFREYREEHHISQYKMGKMVGLSQPMLSKMESGEYNPSIKFLVKAWNILSTKEENFAEKLIGRIYDKVKDNYNYSASIRFDMEIESQKDEYEIKEIKTILKKEIKYNNNLTNSIWENIGDAA